MLLQIWIVIVMNIRSIPQRLWMTLATIFSIAIVVGLLLAFLSMANGFKTSLESGGAEDVLIVFRASSQSELNSVLSSEQIKILQTAPGIKFKNDRPQISNELYVIVDGLKKTTLSKVNLPLRGISLEGIALRNGVSIIEGRMFEPGKNEIIVGQSILKQFSGFTLNKEITFGRSKWVVVGVFSSVASAYESELWTDARDVQNQFQRNNSYSTLRAKLESPQAIEQVKKFAEADPRLNVDIMSEADYFAEQGDAINSIINIGWFLGILMAIGALAGALNTMYNSVASRAREIATLRAIGYSSLSSFTGTIIESLILSFIGGIIGCIAAYLLFDGLTTSTLGASFTQVAFSFKLSQQAIQDAVVLSLIIGFLGGFAPAIRATRLSVIDALNSAGK